MDQRTTYRLFTKIVVGSIKTLVLLVVTLTLYVALGFVAIAADALAVSYLFLSEDDPILNSLLSLMGIVVMIGCLTVVLRARLAPNNINMGVVLFTGLTGFAFGLAAILVSFPPF